MSGVHHTTVIYWVQTANSLPDAPTEQEIPQVTQLDELQTFVGSKKQILAMGGKA